MVRVKKKSGFSRGVFLVIRSLVRFFYGKCQMVGLESAPEEDVVFVGNHAQMNGPIVGELFMPKNCYIWCAWQMMDRKEVPAYAFDDFWSGKPHWTHPFYKALSHLIAPLSECIFNNARTIPVYRDMRIISTFRESIGAFKEKKSLLIFPECRERNNNVVNRFQEHFVDVAKLYYKNTGKEIVFVPIYIAPAMKKAYIGEGIPFRGEADIEEERDRICSSLSQAITQMARDLPEHWVVPYLNVPKKQYVSNKDTEEKRNEKTCC